jgi:hypothetical protein
MEEKRKVGRPSTITKEVEEKICEVIATSDKGVDKLAEIYAWFPRHKELNNHLNKPENKEFATKYARAREDRADYLAQQILEISDNASNDIIEGEFGQIANGAAVQRARLMVDSRKWIASKLAPKKYGDKIQNEISGELGIKPITGIVVE